MSQTVVLEGLGSVPVQTPQSIPEISALVQAARSHGTAIYPVGGGTMLDLGLPPKKAGQAVQLTALNRVIDYPVRDMTVTVQAGITLAALQATLGKEGQWLPIDVPNPAVATLGGALAANVSGPRRLGRGTLRDYVIGISFLTDEGVEVKGGGRVVKNVAGYDLMKLHIGALGTLGIITQVTLKVVPKPEARAAVSVKIPSEKLGTFLDQIHASKSRPIAVEIENFSESNAWTVVIGFEEKAETVNWQLTTLRQELNTAGITELTEYRDSQVESLWQRLVDLQIRPESPVITKLSLKPSQVAEVLGVVARMPELRVHGSGLNGVFFLHSPTVQGISRLRGTFTGGLTVRRAPAMEKTRELVWGKTAGDLNLMHEIKTSLDPKGIFNPARML